MTQSTYDNVVYELLKRMADTRRLQVWPGPEPRGTYAHEREPLHDRIDVHLARAGIVIQEADDERPRYQHPADRILMPPASCYPALNDYYAVLFHEVGHWTGPRLNRPPPVEPSSQVAVEEEMIAEFCSAFLCRYFGIESASQPNAYIDAMWGKTGESLDAFNGAVERAIEAVEYLHRVE